MCNDDFCHSFSCKGENKHNFRKMTTLLSYVLPFLIHTIFLSPSTGKRFFSCASKYNGEEVADGRLATTEVTIADLSPRWRVQLKGKKCPPSLSLGNRILAAHDERDAKDERVCGALKGKEGEPTIVDIDSEVEPTIVDLDPRWTCPSSVEMRNQTQTPPSPPERVCGTTVPRTEISHFFPLIVERQRPDCEIGLKPTTSSTDRSLSRKFKDAEAGSLTKKNKKVVENYFFKPGDRVEIHSYEVTPWLNGLKATVNKTFMQRRKHVATRARIQIWYDDSELAYKNGYPTVIAHSHLRPIDNFNDNG